MAINVVTDANAAAKFVHFQDTKLLNFGAGTVGNAVTRNTETIHVKTKCLAVIHIKLASGTLTFKADKHTADTTDFSAPDIDVSIADTIPRGFTLQLVADDKLSIRGIGAGGGGCVVESAFVVLLQQYAAGKDAHPGSYGFNVGQTDAMGIALTA